MGEEGEGEGQAVLVRPRVDERVEGEEAGEFRKLVRRNVANAVGERVAMRGDEAGKHVARRINDGVEFCTWRKSDRKEACTIARLRFGGKGNGVGAASAGSSGCI